MNTTNTKLNHILGLLPGAVLIPCETGRKGPRESGWQSRSQLDMADSQYQMRLENSRNIAVLLGSPSGGICSIDIDNDDDIAAFAELNPLLTGTLQTKGARGCNFWVKVAGEYPKLTPITTATGEKYGEWRADGGVTMICGLHPSKCEYQFVVDAPPVQIAFDQINWPPGLKLPWNDKKPESPDAPGDDEMEGDSNDELVEKYGAPVFYGQDNGGNNVAKSLNETYWAGLYFSENDVLFEPAEKQFFLYEPGCGIFRPISPDAIKQVVSLRLLEHSRLAPALAPMEKMRSDKSLNAIVAQLRGVAEHRDAFAGRRKIVHLANCMLEFSAAEHAVKEFSPEYFSRNQSPIAFDPAAECPRFLEELVLPAVHCDDVVLLQKYAGQCLLGDNLIQRLVILDGEGGRGKSQFVNVLQNVVGMSNVTQLRTAHLAERFEIFRFLSRTLLVGVDVDGDFLSSKGAAVIKGLCGGDWMDAEQKNGTASFQIQGRFNIVITSNCRLRVKMQGDVSAWRRRLLIVRYESPAPKRKIPNFGELLVREEGPGIINWALEGLQLLLADIEETGDIRLTEAQGGVVDSLLAESDSLRHFLRASLKVAKGCSLSISEIMHRYAHYCPEQGWHPLAEGQILKQLPSLMLEIFQAVKSNSCMCEGKTARGFRGVGFINPEEVL